MCRRPIVGAERRLVAWDLVLGSSSGESLADAADGGEAHLAAMLRAADEVDWDALICGARVLLRADRRLLFHNAVEKLPRGRVWLGLDPVEEIDANLAARLHELHRNFGTRLVFRDYGRRDPREQLLDLADAVEVDAFGGDTDLRDTLVRRAHRRKLDVLARDVHRDEDFVSLRDAGFDLMQGKSYAEPSGGGETLANEDGKVLLELLLDSHGELEITSVTQRVESNPHLAAGLLRLVNGLELARAQKIESVGQALIMVGAQGLARWLNLLLFQVGSATGNRGPLFRVAASRARLMELIVRDRDGDGPEAKDAGETAFLVGILSLVHVLLGVNRAQAIEGLSLSSEISLALSEYSGPLGQLLRLVECIDSGDLAELAQVAGELELAPDGILARQVDAYDWVLRMISVEGAG